MTMTNLDTIDTDKKAPLLVKVSDRFGPSCSFCKQNILHPLPQESEPNSRLEVDKLDINKLHLGQSTRQTD